jgi:hypothetical protein
VGLGRLRSDAVPRESNLGRKRLYPTYTLVGLFRRHVGLGRNVYQVPFEERFRVSFMNPGRADLVYRVYAENLLYRHCLVLWGSSAVMPLDLSTPPSVSPLPLFTCAST